MLVSVEDVVVSSAVVIARLGDAVVVASEVGTSIIAEVEEAELVLVASLVVVPVLEATVCAAIIVAKLNTAAATIPATPARAIL